MNPDPTMVVVRFTLPNGELLEQSWKMSEAHPVGFVNEVLPHVTNPRKDWPHPQDPITYSADVKPGHEAAVRAWLAWGTPEAES
jgi:hypothetical protein